MLCFSQQRTWCRVDSAPTAVLGGARWFSTCTLMSTGVLQWAGIDLLAIAAGAEVGLPSPAALPAVALALEVGLEAAMLYKFMASVGAPKGEVGQKEQQLTDGTRCSGKR